MKMLLSSKLLNSYTTQYSHPCQFLYRPLLFNFLLQDLLLALCEEFELECCASLAQAITRHVTEAKAVRAQGGEEWWKLHEAAMLALGSAQVRNTQL